MVRIVAAAAVWGVFTGIMLAIVTGTIIQDESPYPWVVVTIALAAALFATAWLYERIFGRGRE